MKAFIVYESQFGNTAKIANAIAKGMKHHLEVEVHNVTDPDRPSGADLLVVGGPTHAFSLSRASTRADAVKQGAKTADTDVGLREWLDGLAAVDGIPFATFDTRVDIVRKLPGSAAKAATKRARKLGYSPITRPESFYVQDVSGPLLEGELNRAEVWGGQLGQLFRGEPRSWG
ncbi:flavodoxin domain-containing protein [Diaminobutyricimonas sp. LJ205]|uniref:flavodoxin family protein n=1 Tax=Diaminobutyricimonas sp. LJ205 TaxID=2683590 RepID=UPI0012F499BC|nr:flavodoxin domain-containing protein [Diaminobutyricimonas sp. LJ205]